MAEENFDAYMEKYYPIVDEKLNGQNNIGNLKFNTADFNLENFDIVIKVTDMLDNWNVTVLSGYCIKTHKNKLVKDSQTWGKLKRMEPLQTLHTALILQKFQKAAIM